MRGARHLDTANGWLLDPLSPLDEAHLEAVTPFYGDGIMLTAHKSPDLMNGTIVDNVPIPHDAGYVPFAGRRRLAQYRVPGHDLELARHRAPELQVPDRRPVHFLRADATSRRRLEQVRASYIDVEFEAPKVWQKIPITIELRNDGWETWIAKGQNNYRVGFDVGTERQQAREPTEYTLRKEFDADVPPGGTSTVTVELPALPDTGARYLQVDVVREGVTWFESKGDVPLQITLRASE